MALEELLDKLGDLKNNPDKFTKPEQYYDLARKFLDMEEQEYYKETLELAVNRDVTDFKIFFYYANCFAESDTKRAIGILKEAIRQDKISEKIYQNIITFHVWLGDDEGALRYAEEAFNRGIVNIFTYYSLAELNRHQDKRKAIQYAEEAISQCLWLDDMLYRLSLYHCGLNEYNKAIETLEWGRSLGMNDKKGNERLGLFQYSYGDRNRGCEVWEEEIDKGNFEDKTFSLIALHAYKTKQPEKGIRIGEKAIKMGKSDSDMICMLGNFYILAGRNQDAIKLWEKAIEGNINIINVYNDLGIQYCEIGKKRKAIEVWEKAKTKGFIDELTLKNLIKVYKQLGETDKATTTLEWAKERKLLKASDDYKLGPDFAAIEKESKAIKRAFDNIIKLIQP